MKFTRTQGLAFSALFTALTVVGGFIRFPIPGLTVQFTAQIFFVLLSGLTLGEKYGALSQAAYVLLGLAGLPVLSRGGGISYVLQPEFGYLLGFIGAAFVCGLARTRIKGKASWYIAGTLGLLTLYSIALLYIAALMGWVLLRPVPASTLLTAYCLAFLPLDAVKAVLAASLGMALAKRMKLPYSPSKNV